MKEQGGAEREDLWSPLVCPAMRDAAIVLSVTSHWSLISVSMPLFSLSSLNNLEGMEAVSSFGQQTNLGGDPRGFWELFVLSKGLD